MAGHSRSFVAGAIWAAAALRPGSNRVSPSMPAPIWLETQQRSPFWRRARCLFTALIAIQSARDSFGLAAFSPEWAIISPKRPDYRGMRTLDTSR